MFGLGPTELILIAIIVLLIFGARRLPEIGKGLGGAIKEFKKVKKELTEEETSAKSEDEKKALKDKENPPKLESRMGDKVLEEVPPVKKAVDLKKKADEVKKIIT